MAYFAYKGRNPRGELVQGTLEGADAGAIADQLFNSGVTPVEISSSTATPARIAGGLLLQLRGGVSPIDLMMFSRQMHTLLKAGVPMMKGLAGLQESAANPVLATVVQDLRLSLDSGRELSAAMRRHPKVFSGYYVSLVRVGEMTGRLPEVFDRLAQHIEFESDMRERVKSALRYPMFVVAAMAIALGIVNMFVIPVFAGVFKGYNVPLPLMTRILIGFSDFTVKYWPLLLAMAGLAYVLFRAYVQTSEGRYRWDRLKLRIPIAGKILLKGALARFARSFGLSMQSGVPVVQGLSVVADVVENAYIAERIGQMRDGVERGESVLRTAVTTGVFTPVVLQMIAVGDETGEIDTLMNEIAAHYEREVAYELRTLASQIEPILIVCLAVLVLILALGVFLPIWSLGQVSLRR